MHLKGEMTVAGASMNDIKARIKSVRSTMQITKAMELVATSKLRRAKARVERSRPHHEILSEAINDISSMPELRSSVWSNPSGGEKILTVVIAGDRGLAGGYNSNVFRLADSVAPAENQVILPIGKKTAEYYRYRKRELYTESLEYASDMSVGNALSYAESIARDYKEGKFCKVLIVYTKFVSMLTQTATTEVLLPLEKPKGAPTRPDPIFGGEPEEILDKIVPSYLGGIISAAVEESLAAESAARRTAMNAANKNASEMIDSLMLGYNRARQAVITQEITEIVSGSGG